MKNEIYFVSYTAKDEHIATWIARILEAHGQTVRLEAWDIRAGDNFFLKMHEFLLECDICVPVYSQEYFNSAFCMEEWSNALVVAIYEKRKRVIPVRIADVKPNGILSGRVYIDLHSIHDESEAKEKLLLGFGLKNSRDNKPLYQNPLSKSTAIKDSQHLCAQTDITKIFKNRTISIQSLANNKYLGADMDQPNTPIFAHRPISELWEQFTVEITQDGWAAFKACNNGKYISAQTDKRSAPLFACADTIQAWECFRILLYKENFLLQAQVNSRYVMVDINCSISPGNVGLYACADVAQAWEQFQIEIIG